MDFATMTNHLSFHNIHNSNNTTSCIDTTRMRTSSLMMMSSTASSIISQQRPSPSSSPSPVMETMEMSRVLGILDSAEDILLHDDSFSLEDDHDDSDANLLELENLILEPTPIGNAANINLVSQVPITENSWYQNDTMRNALWNPILLLKNTNSNSNTNSNTGSVQEPQVQPLLQQDNHYNTNDDPEDYMNDMFSRPFKRQRVLTMMPTKDGTMIPLSSNTVATATTTTPTASTTTMKDAMTAAAAAAAMMATTAASDASSLVTEDNHNKNRFRPYQSDQWSERFQELLQFRHEMGHVLVPHNYPPNQQLAQWVKRQRYQYKLLGMGRHSTLTKERLQELEHVGFVWDSHNAAWMEKFQALQEFQRHHGHANVPSNYEADKALAIWVKCQRRQYKLFQKGQRSTMALERLELLNALNFDWNPRNL